MALLGHVFYQKWKLEKKCPCLLTPQNGVVQNPDHIWYTRRTVYPNEYCPVMPHSWHDFPLSQINHGRWYFDSEFFLRTAKVGHPNILHTWKTMQLLEGELVNTLSQKLDKLGEGILQPVCCEAQNVHTAKLECLGQTAPPAIYFVLFWKGGYEWWIHIWNMQAF